MRNRLRILVVDDQQSVLLTYRLVLQQQGHEVTGAPSCECAVEHLSQSEYDLLVCDFGLDSGHNGLDVIDFARQRKPGMASVLLTGFADPDIVEAAEKRGVMLLNKPIAVPDLLDALHTAAGFCGAA